MSKQLSGHDDENTLPWDEDTLVQIADEAFAQIERGDYVEVPVGQTREFLRSIAISRE